MTKAKAIALLNEMHSHCILRSATDAYDDALRDQKGEALMMAIEALSKPTVGGWIPMTKTERMNGHGECSHCHYGNYPKATNPCRDCRWNTEMHPDRWQPKEGGRHDKPYNVQ